MKRFYIIIICVLLAQLGLAQQTKHQKITRLPDIHVFDLKGKNTTLGRLGQNKVTFIDNWFIPCPPCFREMGMLHELYAKYRLNKDVNFVTLCETDPAIVKKFLAKDTVVKRYVDMYQFFSGLDVADFKLPVYFIPGCNMKIFTGKDLKSYAPDDKSKCPDAIFKFNGYPTIIIFDKKGNLVFKKTGFSKDGEKEYKTKIMKILDAALAAN